jgi:hypothetical protein
LHHSAKSQHPNHLCILTFKELKGQNRYLKSKWREAT